MRKVLFVFGTRPEAIKLAPVIRYFQKEGIFSVKICVTGQHREMLDQVMNLFELQADFDLNLMKPNQTLNGVTAGVLEGLETVLSSESFDCLIVHGDTSTTMAASLAGFHRKVPVAHVEAGLRTHNLYSPWPEEANRRVAGMLARWHFAPTNLSSENLLVEKVPQEHIFVTGNTVVDALSSVVKKINEDAGLRQALEKKFHFLSPERKMVLVTGHRRESFGDQFLSICEGLKKTAEELDVDVVYPVHLNPQVQAPVNKILSKAKNVYLLEPLEYVPFVYLMNRSYLIVTDSGGIQEEAPSLKKPVLVMRDITERPEALKAGTIKLVGPRGENIFTEVKKLVYSEQEYQAMSSVQNPYGDGYASERIHEILSRELKA